MLFENIRNTFGPDSLGHAIFYKHQPALRFELGGGESAIDYFTQAYDRARSIAAFAFASSERLTVIQTYYFSEKHAGKRRLLRANHRCGVLPLSQIESLISPVTGDDEAQRYMIAFEVQAEMLPRLLWGILAAELKIKPSLNGELYIADIDGGVLIHPYDDRGIDIIGPNTASLSAIFQRYNAWLLQYDMHRMNQFFAPYSG